MAATVGTLQDEAAEGHWGSLQVAVGHGAAVHRRDREVSAIGTEADKQVIHQRRGSWLGTEKRRWCKFKPWHRVGPGGRMEDLEEGVFGVWRGAVRQGDGHWTEL